MRVRRVLPAVALSATLSLTLAACGGDSGGSASASASGSGSGSGSSEIILPSANPTSTMSPQEQQAVSGYKTYILAQIDDSITKTRQLVEAIKAGDVTRAKSLYAPSRVGWESIEPVAAAFGDIDPKVDLREADLEPGQTWTGWHVIEKALWANNTTQDMGSVGDQLIADLEELKRLAGSPDLQLDTQTMALGAKELMDEIASGKITGEEEAFSHTDLVDFKANLDGARKVFELLRPIASVNDPALVATIEEEFTDVDEELDKYKEGDSYISYDKVTEAQRKELTDVVNALAEPLSKLGAALLGPTSATSSPSATATTTTAP